jgi:hypothetical protein
MLLCILASCVFWFGTTVTCHAALYGVSSIDPAILLPAYSDIVAGSALSIPPNEVITNIANGFPLWYEDTRGRRLELCLQQQVVRADNQNSIFPCLTAEPFSARPIAFPNNFGNEAFYWGAITAGTYLSSDNTLGDLLAVLTHGVSFPNLLVIDGQQAVDSRIRLRANVPVAGTYRVTYPFGTFDYVVPIAGGGREINQTQAVGGGVMDFLGTLADGPLPGVLIDPSINQGVVNNDGASIGPYLGTADGVPILDTDGHFYLAEVGKELTPVLSFIEQGNNGVDYLELRLLDPPDGFFLNAADNSQVVRLEGFQIIGKLFNDAPNQPPVANPDKSSTTPGKSVLIDVLGNDEDPRSIDLDDPFNELNPANTNVHGINDQAIGLIDDLGAIHRTDVLTTALGATVRRVNDAPTGRALFLYTPLPGSQGEDSFSYVVQDHGGLISDPAVVNVTVENFGVKKAIYRPKTGKWEITGSSSDVSANSIDLFTGPRALLKGATETPPVVSEAIGLSSLFITENTLTFQLSVEPLPDSQVTEIHIHVGSPGENGPIIFTLFDSQFDGVFTGHLNAQLNAGNLENPPDAGITSMDDVILAILEGRAYVNLHTIVNPTGEIRGQLTTPLVGSAIVGTDGFWQFNGRSEVSPGIQPLAQIIATSANGNRVLGVPLQVQ